jgi:hypothetical protein
MTSIERGATAMTSMNDDAALRAMVDYHHEQVRADLAHARRRRPDRRATTTAVVRTGNVAAMKRRRSLRALLARPA